MRALITLGVMAVLWASQASASDIENGQKLAKIWCSACHFIEDGKTAIVSDAPNFAVIARKNFSEVDLAQALLSPHPRMPDRGLSREEAADISAYIRSLKVR